MGTGMPLWITKFANSTERASILPRRQNAGRGGILHHPTVGCRRQDAQLDCATPDEGASFAYRFGRGLAFTPDGKTLIASNGDNRVYLWDLASGKERHSFVAHPGRVRSVSVSPDGKMLATSSKDSTVLLWDLSRK